MREDYIYMEYSLYITCIYMLYTWYIQWCLHIKRIYIVYTMYIHGIYMVYSWYIQWCLHIPCIYIVYTMNIHGYTMYIMCICSTGRLMLRRTTLCCWCCGGLQILVCTVIGLHSTWQSSCIMLPDWCLIDHQSNVISAAT